MGAVVYVVYIGALFGVGMGLFFGLRAAKLI